MKIKHFQGYGCVTAKKVYKVIKGGNTHLMVRVTGNHEYGLKTYDEISAFNWLMPHFDKSVKSWMDIKDTIITDAYDADGEVCWYTFIY